MPAATLAGIYQTAHCTAWLHLALALLSGRLGKLNRCIGKIWLLCELFVLQ